jgi:hydroxyethylthiazole kinase-like sugar kinase family protein
MRQHLPFAQNPAFCELEGERIICNDVMLPGAIDGASRYNPHNVRLWLIGHVFGAVCAVFASCDQDALDAACDADALDAFLAEDQTDHENESLTALGNASELFALSDMWMGEVAFDAARDILLITALARAAESGADMLE